MIDGFGMCNALTLSYSRLPVALAEDGFLPSAFARQNAAGAPWVAILLCAAGWAVALNLTFERLISVDLVLYGGSLLLEFVALVVLRMREPHLARPFRVPGGTFACVLLGAAPAALIAIALTIARGERIFGVPALSLSSAIALLGPVVYGVPFLWRRLGPQPPPSMHKARDADAQKCTRD